MHRLELKLSNRKGFTLILSALLIFVFLGAAVMAVDVGHMQLRRADVHAASDAAALAGIEEYVATGRVDSALAEAKAFAGRFKADNTVLTLANADFKLGQCPSTGTCNSGSFVTTGLTPGDTNAAEATVRFTGSLTFAKALYGHISSHNSSATSRAVGVSSKSVTKSSCVAPVVMSYQQMLDQIMPGRSMSDSLTQADIDSLSKATAGKAITFDIPNGTKVNSLDEGEFYQINVPPVELANGTVQADGPPSASDFRNGFTCTGGAYAIGIGDWVEPINGQKANQAKKGVENINNSTFPVTIEVALAANFGNSPHGGCTDCFQIKYLGSFVVTGVGGKSITGYFGTLAPPSGGIVATGTSSGPLEKIKTHLVF